MRILNVLAAGVVATVLMAAIYSRDNAINGGVTKKFTLGEGV